MTTPRFCPSCGAARIEGGRFCGSCGFDLDSLNAAAEPAPPATTPLMGPSGDPTEAFGTRPGGPFADEPTPGWPAPRSSLSTTRVAAAVAVLIVAVIAIALGVRFLAAAGAGVALASPAPATSGTALSVTPTPIVTAAPIVTPAPTRAPTPRHGPPYVIGYANGGGVGNGFREEQVCTARAEALASGIVSSLPTIHHNTDAAGQLTDIRALVTGGVDAIVFYANDPSALNPALAEAHAAGIVTVSVDSSASDPDTWNVYVDQVEYGYLGARWLFDRLGGSGTVYYLRGLEGHPADIDRDRGFRQALAEYPGITVFPDENGAFSGWDPVTATRVMDQLIASGQYDQIDGVWTSGMGSQVVDAIRAAGRAYVPIVGADQSEFVAQLLDAAAYPGLDGAAVTNTAAVGGAGVSLALRLLQGENVPTSAGADRANTVLVDPIAVDNTTASGRAQLSSWQSVPGLDPLWPMSLTIDGWSTYSPRQAVACTGP
jgi:ribose transport system substrate-binding protein